MTSSHELTRRGFLQQSGRGVAALGTANLLAGCSKQTEPGTTSRPADDDKNGPRLGLDTYTLHRCLTAKDPKNRRDLWWVLDQVHQQGLDGVQIDPSHFKSENFDGGDEAVLERLASVVGPRGHYVEFGMGGWDVTHMTERIKLTARFGGKALRTFCGSENDGPDRLALFMKHAPPALHEAGAIAEQHDVDIAVENHGDFTSDQLKELLDKAGHPRVGACFDTGNSMFRKEDPIKAARTLAPYAKSMHLKDWTLTHRPDGSIHWQEKVPGTGEVPVAKVLDIVLSVRPDLYIAMETPVMPSDDESETVAREHRHFVACAKAAREILASL